jgi:hypothetical protein
MVSGRADTKWDTTIWSVARQIHSGTLQYGQWQGRYTVGHYNMVSGRADTQWDTIISHCTDFLLYVCTAWILRVYGKANFFVSPKE